MRPCLYIGLARPLAVLLPLVRELSGVASVFVVDEIDDDVRVFGFLAEDVAE